MFKFLKRKRKSKDMQKFSKEYLDDLIAEHRLVSASITHITQVQPAKFYKTHGSDAVSLALQNLYAKKVQLEAMIDVLSEYIGS
jgi:hypothetical protein